MSILIVDDSASQRFLLTSILKASGHTALHVVGSAEEAYAVLNDPEVAAGVQLILMDIAMPVVNGIEACRTIKAMPGLYDTPIIMVTASNESSDLESAFDAGAIDYITKPPNRVELMARVNSALQLKTEMDHRKAREQQLLDYVSQVQHVTAAAAAVETNTFDPDLLHQVVERSDALGQLARVFQRMASEVVQREQRLQAELLQLRIEIDEVKKSSQVESIMQTEYFRELQRKVQALRTHVAEHNDNREDQRLGEE